MRARVVVFPIRGRAWVFSRSLELPAAAAITSASAAESAAPPPPPTLKVLWEKVSARGRKPQERAEAVVDFVADKMNGAWSSLERAPKGTFKSKIHSLGLRLLSQVKPSEIFLKSVSKDITKVEITYPVSLNPRLVRRRLRHIALRGAALHRKYLYGSVFLLPVSSVFTVLPLPNIPFFWILFRAYSHWRALKGSERLVHLVSDSPTSWNLLLGNEKENGSKEDSNNHRKSATISPPWVFDPSEDLERLLRSGESSKDGVDYCRVSRVCEAYTLDKKHVLKYIDFLK
ncbi:uncharacterized protein LOC109706556 [Ananas comosus]|uniref:Uncharacterized protein LOC109706556 n=1 Tax=Ananas comosus TaxID=4615 RepID=A0A6P5EI54_ANACO|nr:uncharacterized protein LOC109706556 [Ananas comosus]